MPPLHQCIDHPDKKPIRKTLALDDTLDHIDVTDRHTTFRTKAIEYTFLRAQGIFPRSHFWPQDKLCVFFFFFCTTSHGSWDLSSGPGNKPGSSEVKVWLPNHWTTRNFAKQVLINLMRLNAIKHLSHPWWYENRSQLQEENWESDRCGAENHLLLNSWWFREEIRREVKQDFQRNGKGNTARQTHRAQQRQLSEGLCVYA